MDGVLVIDKPQGPTSHDVVSKVRRALKEKKVGHTGTLDPMATGVLPLVLGRATKLARYMSGTDKTYRATLQLGATTRTLDAEGELESEQPVECTEEQVREALESFVGVIQQVPPMYSAKKIDGTKLYTLARKGIEVEREAKPVHIHFIREVSCSLPEVTFDVRVSAGTYVRVLAHDIGQKLGCGAYLKALRRTEAGLFSLEGAVALEAVLEDPSLAQQSLFPVGRALASLPCLRVPPDIARLIATGYQLSVADLRTLDAPTFVQDDALAVAVDGGDVIAVARAEMASDDLPVSRRDRRALKTERVLVAC